MKGLITDKSAVGPMFDNIAFRYDFLNHFLSFGIDRIWRKKAIKLIPFTFVNPEILDVATGTGDLAVSALRLHPAHISGIDISREMLKIAEKKFRDKGLSGKVDLIQGRSESIPFRDNSFDIAMVAFGVRNFSDPLKGLMEMQRVLKKGGVIMILEFSRPAAFPFKQLFSFYFLKIVPFIGRLFSGNRNAYTYLPESVSEFPENEQFTDMLENAGFMSVKQTRLTGGVASVYSGLKI
jgi:demethylmenaquinone methyltransferase/2-methoxy-6-polyprenyl-1,4-benzoquinol methylase